MSHRRSPGLTFLLEIGTEEIPARMMRGALESLAGGLRKLVIERDLASAADLDSDPGLRTYGTPRRLAVQIGPLRQRQPDRSEEVTGPPVKAAYDASGKPTRAAEGFARAQGVTVADLLKLPTPRGECVGVRRDVRGAGTAEVLAEIVPPLVESMSFPKTMRWGTGMHRFVRPVHSVLALLDRAVVDLTIAGIRAGNATFGHRFAGKSRIPLSAASGYLDALRRNGVVADIDERRRMITEQIDNEARNAGGRIAPPPGSPGDAGDPELLEEVVHLVEWPLVVSGEFDASFLALPAEILVTAMRHHQRYFSLLAPDGTLLNRFLAVANCAADPSGAIRRGNTWVLHARLADARFFRDDDRRTALTERVPALGRLTFHMKLGSYLDKSKRIARLAEAIMPAFVTAGHEVDKKALLEATRLCKADLTTQMVGEFPELQGIVGALYASEEGQEPAVGHAIREQYLPAGPEDPLPSTPEGAILSIADRLDTQTGIFLLGLVPTGSSDPYALRRSVLGACRILIGRQVHVSLSSLIEGALEAYGGTVPVETTQRSDAAAALLEFYRARLQFLGEEANLRHDSVRAALAVGSDGPFDAHRRMQALDDIRRDAGFDNLAIAHKRIKKIIQGQKAFDLRPDLLSETAERDLHDAVRKESSILNPALQSRDYVGALQSIARLRPVIDHFFEDVMVLAKDRNLRENRLALLQGIAGLFQRVGDFSEIVVESDTASMGPRRSGA